MNDRERIGLRIKELRTLKGLSYRGLAELTGLDHNNISKIEKGRYNAGIDILSKIANALSSQIEIVPTHDSKAAK